MQRGKGSDGAEGFRFQMSPGNGRAGARREERGRGGLAAAAPGLMRKAGAKEGSIGSKGAIDVNRSPVSVAVTGRQSDLMIKACSCTGRSSLSSLCNLNNTGVSMTCKGCSDESTTDKSGPLCSSKLNSMRFKLPRPIDIEVRWKNVNRRQRAARRARTSFFGEDRLKDELRSFYGFGNAMNREMSQEDAPVSDSEKLGVSILGRRFSEPMGNVPIKKRRFHMDCSPSPPPTPLLVDPYEKILRSCSGGIPSYEKRRKVKLLEDECKEEHIGLFDADDFSGISILAAAACESAMNDDMLNGTCSKLVHPLEERKLENTNGSTELSLLHGMKGNKSNVLEASDCDYDRPFESSISAPDTKPLFATAHTSSENLGELACAGKTEIASDVKSSGVAMLSDSCTPDKSIGCSQYAAAKNKCANATRDSRLHWDLNVAMEAWDTDCGHDDDRGGPTVATVSDRNDAEDDMNKPQLPHDHESIHAGDSPDLSVEIHMVDVPKDVNTMDEGDFPADTSSLPLQHQSSQNLEVLKPEYIGKDTSAETLDLTDQQKSRFASTVDSHLGSNPEPALISEHFLLSANVEKNDGSHAAPIGIGSSHMSSVDGHVGDNSTKKSEPASTVKPLASRLVSEESTNLPTVTAFRKITNVGWSDNKLEEASEQSISEWKNHELLDDSGTSKLLQLVSKKDEHGTDVLKSTVDTENLTHPEYIPGSPVCNMANVHEEDGADAMTNSKDCLITCASSSSAETYYISGVVQAPAFSSECNKPVITDAGSIVDSQAVAHSYQNIYENKFGKVASVICLEHCYETDASCYSKGVPGIGKVKEDDSQYEDGEVRESGDCVDNAYDVKCGNCHYPTSDYNNEVTTSDMPHLPIHSASKTLGIPVAGYSGAYTRKEDDTVSPVLSKRSWSTNCLDGSSGANGKAQGIHSIVAGETQMPEINPVRVAVEPTATVSQRERCNDGLGDDDLSSIRTKNTGWDMFPEDQRHSWCDSRDRADSSNRCVLSSIDAGGGDDSFRKTGLVDRDVQRIERPRSFDRSHRNELSRSDDGYASGPKAERAIDSHRSSSGCDLSRHIQAGCQGEQVVENSKHPRSTRRKSPECYNYGPAGPRNAAEAAVAKMKSNGFVVARDGTLVRAVDATNDGHVARRMRNTLNSSYHPLSGRGSPTDRDGSCGLSRGPSNAREASPESHFVGNNNWTGRYGPEMEKGLTSNGNLSSLRCSLSCRQQNIPTARASLNLSRAHSRSPGSRSRSPHDWASPRNRRKIMANGGSTFQRPSRSPPNRLAKVRMARMTSPQRQPGYDDRALHYSPPSRNRNYSHASTWVDGRNSSTIDHSDHTERYSRRSPMRITPRNDRFDAMESHGQSRTGELYRPTQGRLQYGYSRENKHDGNGDDQREHTGRHESHSVKPYRNGSIKQFRNNAGDKLRTRISAPRSPKLQKRASLRRFDRSFER